MDMHDSLNVAIEKAVRSVVRGYVESVRARQLNLVVVFTGAKLGCADAVASLATLKDKGYTFKVLMSEKAASILDVEVIDRELLPKDIWIGEPPTHAEAIARDADTIVVPTLSASSCAHVASIMTDTAAQACITEGLMLGKSVVCAVDGCCPDNPLRAKGGFKFTAAMAQRMRDNRDMVRDYGAVFCAADHLAEKVLQVQEESLRERLGLALGGLGQAPAAAGSPACGIGAAKNVVEFSGGKVLDAGLIRSLSNGTQVIVPAGTLVTQLARDVARANDISLIF